MTFGTFDRSDEKTRLDQNISTYLYTFPPTSIREHPKGAILETCDLWNIWSEWWGDMTWPTNIARIAVHFQCHNCVIQDPRFSWIFIFSFGTSFQDTYCLLFRCICNPSQSISLNARLTKDIMFSWSTLLWILQWVNKRISPLITERLVAALPPPPLFQKLLRLRRIHRHWFHIPGKWTEDLDTDTSTR